MENKLFHIYKDGVQIWPIGVIRTRRWKGFGVGFFKGRGEDLIVGMGVMFSIQIIQINWKAHKGQGVGE